MALKARIETLLAGLEYGVAAFGVESGAALEINGGTLFPTASVFKVPVMVEVYAQARAGKFAMTDRIALDEGHKTIGSGVLQKLAPGLAPTVRDLVMLMIIISDNTATDMLVEKVGAANVTARMRALGLSGIHVPFGTHHLLLKGWNLPVDGSVDFAGLKAATRGVAIDYGSGAFARDASNNTATAADMARLCGMIARGEAGDAADCADMITVMELQHFQDRVPRFLPTGSVANKTGTLTGLRNDAGLIRRGSGDTIAYAVFTFDPTRFPAGNSRPFAEANARIATLMGEVGAALWEDFR